MTSFIRSNTKVQLYFNCPEKMDRIARMCKETNYEDMTLIISTKNPFTGRQAKHRIRFGKGWMEKDAEIQLVDYIYGGSKGIIIFTTVSDCVEVIDCWLECPRNRIHLGRPTDFEIGWDVRPWILMEEDLTF